jgi:hypothetical protein
MPDTIPGGPHTAPGVTARIAVIERGWFQRLQALEDAIAYRRARASGPCPDCTASGHACDDHACDLQLIAAYQQTAIAAILDVSRRIDAGLADHDRGIFSAATAEKIR